MTRVPHQHALRKGRFTTPGAYYSLTSCLHNEHPLLIPDPSRPLSVPIAPRLIEGSLRWLHVNGRWQCKCYVVMPDHVHIVCVLERHHTLSQVMTSFGRHTARRLNELRGRSGPVWQHGFYDHCLRDEEALLRHMRYVIENPLRKGFVQRAEDWPYAAVDPPW